jgi:ribosomal protein S27AE
MTEHFVKLSCGNCGGGLEVYDDLERFACGHCGAEMEVQRRGGTIVLRIVTGAVGKVQIGAEPAATELALRRLKEEAENLSKRREAFVNQRIDRKKWGYVIGVALLLIGFFVVRSGNGFVVGLSVLMAGIVTISYIRRSDKRTLADLRELQAKIDVINGRVEDHACHARPS